MIEVEARSFITKKEYEKLIDFFKENAKFLKEDYQETFYFDCQEDLRIQKNNFFSKIWLKKGKIHDEAREEIEIKFAKEDFDELEKLFLSLGYNVKIKWFRTRNEFEWEGIKVCLDYTRGYGYIIEFERMTDEACKEKEYAFLKERLESLGIRISSKEEFDAKFNYYKENWKSLVEEDNK